MLERVTSPTRGYLFFVLRTNIWTLEYTRCLERSLNREHERSFCLNSLVQSRFYEEKRFIENFDSTKLRIYIVPDLWEI